MESEPRGIRSKQGHSVPIQKCVPLFSNEDADLRNVSWWTNRGGYAKRQSKQKNVRAHRIVLSRIIGRDVTPHDICDHVNRNKLDNRRENLRLVTLKQNAENRTPTSSSGFLDVTWHRKKRKWQAQVSSSGKAYYCGLHSTPEQASQAASSMRSRLGMLGGSIS